MADLIVDNEPAVRLVVFFIVFLAIVAWETALPRRQRLLSRLSRWPANLGIVVLNTVVSRVVAPMGVVGMALAAETEGWGLFNQVAVPFWLVVLLSVFLLDLAIYVQHVMFHAIPPLWRLHRMHHADQDFDVTTGARFHPIEVLISLGIKMCAVILLGAPAIAVVVFEVMLNATAMFNHGNQRLPVALDRMLRLIVVTPDMHRVHHSVIAAETNSNFGFNFPWWDRLLGTYRAQPSAGHDNMTIGIEAFRDERDQRFDKMLLQPFRPGKPGKQGRAIKRD